jgi:hypothetical protein
MLAMGDLRRLLEPSGCGLDDGSEGKVPSRQPAGCRRYEAGPFLAFMLFLCCLSGRAAASDWKGPTEQLARKIVATTGPGAVALTVENRSSLPKKDVDGIAGTLRVDLESMGARPALPDHAAASVAVWLSENPGFYVWVAEIRQGAGESAVVMVSVERANELGPPREGAPVNLRKIPLWAQEERILDVAVLEEDRAPSHIAVLDGEKVAIYQLQNGKWQQKQRLEITHSRPWPRDLRGRMMLAKDHLLDVYLPGVFCRSTTSLPLALNCRESDDPWPLAATTFTPVGGEAPSFGAFYSASRNFFTGALTPGVGKLTNVGKFYSAAALPREKYVLWVFARTDGLIHLVDGVTDQATKLDWGSDVATVKTGCGLGWQVLAAGTGDNPRGAADSVRAYEIADRDPVPVSAALDFSGEIIALWTQAKGDRAIAVAQNRETRDYEAFLLEAACGD